MGYYTTYELEITEGTDIKIDYQKELEDIMDYEYLFDGETKWYDHEINMKEYSKKYPDTVFVLSGEGEEAGDLWKKYFKNGKMQVSKATIAYDKYDESKLS